jgi:lantibiotic modifying enzyme
LKEAIYHYENDSIGSFDENQVPFIFQGEKRYYSVVYVIQYALIQHEFIMDGDKIDERKKIMLHCIDWLISESEDYLDSIIWRSKKNIQYNLEDGWVSGMYQGQAISLFLRAYQLFNDDEYLEIAKKAFVFFDINYEDGGAKRIDENGYLWYEEYPTDPPSYVLNGYVYAIFGLVDYYRVTKSNHAKELFDSCVVTLVNNVHKYDKWYWSIYDQKKEQLVSYYYQKNVHIPLMGILYQLTGNELFKKHELKWKKQLQNPLYKFIVQVMYRVQPRLKRLKNG